MKTNQIKLLLFDFFTISLFMVLIPKIITIDIMVLKNELSETSLTEYLQEFFILISAIIFLKASLKHSTSKGFFILVTGLFTMMFVREVDYYLDFIMHGFWKIPAIIIFLITIYYAFKNKNTITQALLTHSQTKQFTYIFIGFMIIVLFSRLFGTGSLWRDIMGENYNHIYKTVIQEGIELFGYSLLFYGSVLFHFKEKKS